MDQSKTHTLNIFQKIFFRKKAGPEGGQGEDSGPPPALLGVSAKAPAKGKGKKEIDFYYYSLIRQLNQQKCKDKSRPLYIQQIRVNLFK